jgi:hypothetical protein
VSPFPAFPAWIVACCAGIGAAGGNEPGVRARDPGPALASLPLLFVENCGQEDPAVRFTARCPGLTAWFLGDGVMLSPRPDRNASLGAAVWLRFSGAASSEPVAREPQPTCMSFFRGPDPARWLSDVATSARVVYPRLYDGIDLVFHGQRGRLEYDLIVAPGGDLAAVRLECEGADGVSLRENGDLEIHTALGPILQAAPQAWLVRPDGSTRVAAARVRILGERAFGFEAAPVPDGHRLVIDPQLVYSTYLGGSGLNGFDFCFGVAADAQGNAYIAGYTGSDDFPVTPGAFHTTPTSTNDGFVAKIAPGGTALVYATYLGGKQGDSCDAIAVDADGNAYVTGACGADFPVTPGAFDTTPNGLADAFVTKLAPAGNALVFSTFLGGAGAENVLSWAGIAVDQARDVYVSGVTYSSGFPVTANAVQPNLRGASDAFFAKLSSDGSQLLHGTFLGGQELDASNAVAVHPTSGRAHVSGGASSGFPTTPGALQPNYGGSGDAFLIEIDTLSGAAIHSTYLGGSGDDGAWAMALGADGSVYLAGHTDSADFPTTAGAYSTTFHGGAQGDGFVARVSQGGSSLVYSTFIGSPGPTDWAWGVAVDADGIAFVTGTTASGSFPVTPNAYDPTYNGAGPFQYGDAYLLALDPTGKRLLYSTFFGGSKDEHPRALARSASGRVFLVGYTDSTDLPTTAGALQSSFHGGGWDGFVAAFDLPLPTSCGGGVATYCTAQVNSQGCLPAISSTGTPSASAPSGFLIEADHVLAGVIGILVYSTNGPASTPFNGGVLCLQAPLRRTPAQVSQGSGACGGLFSFDFNAHIASGVDPQLTVGATFWAQYWSRDPASAGHTNLTDALLATICP